MDSQKSSKLKVNTAVSNRQRKIKRAGSQQSDENRPFGQLSFPAS